MASRPGAAPGKLSFGDSAAQAGARGTVLEEADESGYWIELLILTEAGKIDSNKSAALHGEANELLAIAVSSINTARRNSDLQV